MANQQRGYAEARIALAAERKLPVLYLRGTSKHISRAILIVCICATFEIVLSLTFTSSHGMLNFAAPLVVAVTFKNA